ncbi:MAG: pyruvate formate lyase family protein, partial [Oscillospiraceae bacterium]|nr:pyruvate formate lyase family protein [Oscillospiraceae bacterium]
MYKFRPVTERIQRYRDAVRDRVIIGDSEKSVYTAEAIKLYGGIVPIIKRPLITKYLCEHMSVPIFSDDYFAGSKGKNFCGASGVMWGVLPIENMPGKWEWHEDDQMWHNTDPEQRLAISQEELDKTRLSSSASWENADSAVGDAWQPDGFREFVELEACDYGDPGRPGILGLHVGHLTPGWSKIINTGYKAIREQAQAYLAVRKGNVMGGDMSKYMFYKSATIVCDAAMILIRRYGDEAKRQADLPDTAPERKAELIAMSESLYWISENPARTLWEACQAVLLYQLLLSYEQTMPAPAFGRFDQYVWPFLKKELDEGTITLDGAQILVDAFFLKSNCYYEGGYGKMAETAGIGNTYQHTTISGCIPETGEDATNPVTYMVLETIGRLKLHDPTVSMRVHSGTPDELWNCALETSKLVGGLPLFQNDEVIIPGLQKELGFTLEDARDYSIIGCQEIVGSGCDFPAPNGVGAAHASIYYGVVFDMALNNGINPMNGKQAPVQSGYLYEMNSIEEVQEAYRKLSEYMLNWYVTVNNYAEYLAGYNLPYAMLSISMRGCMERGIDCSSGGCDYNSYGGTATGLATIADSLATIKYMCFDKKLCTT